MSNLPPLKSKRDSSTEPFATFKDEFQTTVPASALLFNNDHNKALRVECPTIGMEFTDSLYIGHDPEGFLYYNAIDDFEMQKHDGTPVTHHYKILRFVYQGRAYVVIEYLRDSDNECYAKFLAEDHTGAVAAAGMADYSNTGEWRKLVRGSSSATLVKESSSPLIVIYADGIGKVGEWTAHGHVLKHKHFTVKGTLYFKLISEIQHGNHANCNHDRIAFYKDHWTGKDITAYFIPLEIETERLTFKAVFSKVKWFDIPEEKGALAGTSGTSDPVDKPMIV